jgi:hypothetical protein
MTLYTPSGPWVNGGAPAISAAFLTALEQWLAYAADSNITSDGTGKLTTIGNILNGMLVLQSPSTQTLSNGNTITLPAGAYVKVTCGSNVTGIIMTSGSVAGQLIFLYNVSSAGSITFAASGSNVRGGSNVSANGGRLLIMIWDGTSQWAPSANP